MTEKNNGKYICKAITSEGPLETSAYLAVEPAKRKRKDLNPTPFTNNNNKVFAVGNVLAKDNGLNATLLTNEQRRIRHLKRQQLRRRRIARRKKLQEKALHKLFNVTSSPLPTQNKKHNEHHKKNDYNRYDVKDSDYRPNSVFGSWFAS